MVKTRDLSTDMLYVKQYILSTDYAPSVLFIHGGPGLNSATLERFITQQNYFNTLRYNLVVYDQRSCGRSRLVDNVTHLNNVEDLSLVVNSLNSSGIRLSALIGHSYGAKVLFDYKEQVQNNVKLIFVGTAKDIIIPRVNNLLLDLNYLKLTDPEKYQKIFNKFSVGSIEELWHQTTVLAATFNQNPDRVFYYWANLDIYKLFKEYQAELNLPCNMNVFETVRKDLYTGNFELNFDQLTEPYIVINGFNDYVMNGYNDMFSGKGNIKVFGKSGHYPHLEENERFCEVINQFV
jgi:proline iminopeptidase